MRFGRSFKAVAAASVSLATLVGGLSVSAGASVGEHSAKSKAGSLTFGLSSQILTLNLPDFRSSEDLMVGPLVFQGLVQLKNGQPAPMLATSWKATGNRIFTFQLRKGVKFQDGAPFNAAAAKTFFEKAKSELQAKTYIGNIKSITTHGSYQITITLSQATSSFLHNLGYPVSFIQSPQSLAKYNTQTLPRHPTGTGPFKLQSWNGTTLVFKRSATYWGTKPSLSKVTFEYVADTETRYADLESGQINVDQTVAIGDIPQLKASSKLAKFTAHRGALVMLSFNTANPILKKFDVREAIAMAINRTPLIDILKGAAQKATGFVPPVILPTKTKLPSFNVTKAKQLLAKAGYPHGFSITLWTTSGPSADEVGITENVQAQLQQIGINAKIVNQAYASYIGGISQKKQELAVLEWGFTATPQAFFTALFGSAPVVGSLGWLNYSNDKVNALIQQTAVAPTAAAADRDWRKLDQILVTNLAALPLYWPVTIWGISKSVRHLDYTSLGLLELTKTKVSS